MTSSAVVENFGRCLMALAQRLESVVRAAGQLRIELAATILRSKQYSSSGGSTHHSTKQKGIKGCEPHPREGLSGSVETSKFYRELVQPLQLFLDCERIYYEMKYLEAKHSQREAIKHLYNQVTAQIVTTMIPALTTLHSRAPDDSLKDAIRISQQICQIVACRVTMITLYQSLVGLRNSPDYEELVNIVEALASKFATRCGHPTLRWMKLHLLFELRMLRLLFQTQVYLGVFSYHSTMLTLLRCSHVLAEWHHLCVYADTHDAAFRKLVAADEMRGVDGAPIRGGGQERDASVSSSHNTVSGDTGPSSSPRLRPDGGAAISMTYPSPTGSKSSSSKPFADLVSSNAPAGRTTDAGVAFVAPAVLAWSRDFYRRLTAKATLYFFVRLRASGAQVGDDVLMIASKCEVDFVSMCRRFVQRSHVHRLNLILDCSESQEAEMKPADGYVCPNVAGAVSDDGSGASTSQASASGLAAWPSVFTLPMAGTNSVMAGSREAGHLRGSLHSTGGQLVQQQQQRHQQHLQHDWPNLVSMIIDNGDLLARGDIFEFYDKFTSTLFVIGGLEPRLFLTAVLHSVQRKKNDGVVSEFTHVCQMLRHVPLYARLPLPSRKR